MKLLVDPERCQPPCGHLRVVQHDPKGRDVTKRYPRVRMPPKTTAPRYLKSIAEPSQWNELQTPISSLRRRVLGGILDQHEVLKLQGFLVECELVIRFLVVCQRKLEKVRESQRPSCAVVCQRKLEKVRETTSRFLASLHSISGLPTPPWAT